MSSLMTDDIRDHSKIFSFAYRESVAKVPKSYLKLKNLQLLQAITPFQLESKAQLASCCFNLYYTGTTSLLTDTG